MAHDLRTERLLATVELVRSRGDAARGKLCIMSLVARLAEEPHSDRPTSASPVIAAFARPLNDAMDRQTRQRLIPFAPRIQGTRASLDTHRQDVMDITLVTDVLPRLTTDLRVAATGDSEARGAEWLARLASELRETPRSAQPRLIQSPEWDGVAFIGPLRTAITARRDGHGVQQAEAFARLLIAGAYGVARPSRRAWYWDQGVAILDRMCEMEARGDAPSVVKAKPAATAGA
jgi:hypothetical protein